MSALSNVLRGGDGGRMIFRCPGCKEEHAIVVAQGRWSWNGDVNRPTFTPSVLVQSLDISRDANGEWDGGWVKDAHGQPVPTTCHSFVTDGRIQFLGDCTHALAGQTVDLPEWTE